MLPVVLDCMGGDHAPREAVAGAVGAVRDHDVPLILVGPARRLRTLLAEHDAAGKIPIVHTDQALEMGEGALASWRKPRSTVAIACELIKHGKAGAMVSAGSTAGVVATSAVRLKGQHGIMRPAIAVALPTLPLPTVLLDAGATADAKPEMLLQFAMLGTAYAQSDDTSGCTTASGATSGSLSCPGIANPSVSPPNAPSVDPGNTGSIATPALPKPPEVPSVAPEGKLRPGGKQNRSRDGISNSGVKSPSIR